MPIDRKQTRWNGWGWVGAHNPLEGREAVWTWIAAALGVGDLPETPAKPLEQISLPAPKLAPATRQALSAIVGAAGVRDDAFERASHARGKSFHDLLHLRAGDLSAAPDAVVYPRSGDEVVRVLKWASDNGMAVVPFGGGSSVVGGVTASAGSHASISLDLTEMRKVIVVDEVSLTATAEAGIYGKDLEAALNAKGFTLGHFPQSYEFSTLGGWIAARGAGQQSARYGKAEDWFAGCEIATPKGLWKIAAVPASAAGPDLRTLVAGSEGAFGVITSATARIHHLPRARDYTAFLFRDFASGVDAVRRVVQTDLPLAMLRLSDADETYFFQAFAKAGQAPNVRDRLQAAFLKAMRVGDRPCALLVGVEGDEATTAFAGIRARALFKLAGGVAVGRSPARRWYASRFHGPYSRDPLMDRGLGVDTLETATNWSNITRLWGAVRDALDEAMRENAVSPGAHGIVLGHVSHTYHDGASLYFTYIYPRDPAREVAQWQAIKKAAGDAIAAAGGTISHHHGVGEDHLPWLAGEKGAIGMEVLHAVKRELDPNGVMNPGKLLRPSSP
jgi:alkyldihydroxyacetonephosphate synthase